MKYIALILITISCVLIQGCGTLDSKTIQITHGDDKNKVLSIMGMPDDRQMKQYQEAWQYCVSGAGFGYNDHKVIWFYMGTVSGVTSYKTTRTGCMGGIRQVNWQSAPDFVVETRNR